MRFSILSRLVVTGSMLLIAPVASWSEVLVFKDGETLVTRGRYRLAGDRIFVTLQSGAETSFPAVEIDLAKTDEMNRITKGSAVVIDTVQEGQPASRQSERTLRDVMRPAAPEPPPIERVPPPESLRRTPTGNVDLLAMQRRAVGRAGTAERITALLREHGLRNTEVYQGSTPNRVLIDLVTANRTEVFSALQKCAEVMLAARAEFPDIQVFELAMSTSARSRAGQFVLTPEDAEGLASGAVAPADHFLAKVLF